jgi:hypothetical protein
MKHRLERPYGLGHLHFITFSCYRRLPLLGSAQARNVFVQILGEVRDEFGFALVGFLVMPEHVQRLSTLKPSPCEGGANYTHHIIPVDPREVLRLRSRARTNRGKTKSARELRSG